MFIAWIPQIISMVNYKKECFLDQLLLRITRAYPSAIYYPFQLFLNQNKRGSNITEMYSEDIQTRSLISEVLDIVHNPLAEKFTKGLNNLCLPELKLTNRLYGLQVAIVQTTNMSQRVFVKQVKWIVAEVFSDAGTDLCGKILDRIQIFKETVENLVQFDCKYNTVFKFLVIIFLDIVCSRIVFLDRC